MAEKSDRTDADNEELTSKLAAVRNQLEMAELLGYGDQDDYESLYTQLDAIEKETEDGQSGKGSFDKMKDSISNLWVQSRCRSDCSADRAAWRRAELLAGWP